MGLYQVAIKAEKIKDLPNLMQSLGFPVVQNEDRENGRYYFYEAPRRSNGRPARNPYFAFWITHEQKDRPRYFMSGLSQSSGRIVNSLRTEGFIDDEGAASDRRRQRQWAESEYAKLATKESRDRKEV